MTSVNPVMVQRGMESLNRLCPGRASQEGCE